MRVKAERAELAQQEDIEQDWDYNYFLESFMSIARSHFGVAA